MAGRAAKSPMSGAANAITDDAWATNERTTAGDAQDEAADQKRASLHCEALSAWPAVESETRRAGTS